MWLTASLTLGASHDPALVVSRVWVRGRVRGVREGEEMTPKEMFKALGCLSYGASIMLDCNDQWFVNLPSVDIAEDGMLVGKCGRGDEPAAAIVETWNIYSQAPRVKALDKYYQWAGYMWREVQP